MQQPTNDTEYDMDPGFYDAACALVDQIDQSHGVEAGQKRRAEKPLPSPPRLKSGNMQEEEEQRQEYRRPVSEQLMLPEPSPEQQCVIDGVRKGQCMAIPSVAGSGKTTCMLQVAARLPRNRKCVIVTYNRSLRDDCTRRIHVCGMSHRVKCFTIHGLVSYMAQTTCNDDVKLKNVVDRWTSADIRPVPGDPDLFMLDEVQDLRPTLYEALCRILKFSRQRLQGRPIQLCLVGDPKQLLYDLPTYGKDKANVRYMQDLQECWSLFTTPLQWTIQQLSVSYRLTPNVATFCNAVWGTNIVGGNLRDPNIPVEYLVEYPFPAKRQGPVASDGLQLSFFEKLIDSHGPENVMLLAQSVKNEKCPIRVLVNELLKIESPSGGPKYNFHVKESIRGFEGNSGDYTNKVRVWTFCGSKGCEADVVVVFGFDRRIPNMIHSLNQVGVALSRAKKRLIVIHGKSRHQNSGQFEPNGYYPLLGDTPDGLYHRITKSLEVEIPPYNGDMEAIESRAKRSHKVFMKLEKQNILVSSKGALPCQTKMAEGDDSETVYLASEFSHFSVTEESRFLQSYGLWTKESGVQDRIEYQTDVHFCQTKEDVSALYGEALVYMLQWRIQGYCPNIETVVGDGILRFNISHSYKLAAIRKYMFDVKNCERLSDKDNALLEKEVKLWHGQIKGHFLIRFLNSRIKVQKIRQDGDRTIRFRVKAMEEKSNDDDEIMQPFVDDIRRIYSVQGKEAFHYMYLANAVMAFGQYHDKWKQIGTDPLQYRDWVDSKALEQGLLRLMCIFSSTLSYKKEGNDEDEFEEEILHQFEEQDYISSTKKCGKVVGVIGILDWLGAGMVSCQGEKIDLVEIKFVNELANMHRLQLQTYCALLSTRKQKEVSGMIFNARTGECEVCKMIDPARAAGFLLDICWFKYDGTVWAENVTRYVREMYDGPVEIDETDIPEHKTRKGKGTQNEPIEIDGSVLRGNLTRNFEGTHEDPIELN